MAKEDVVIRFQLLETAMHDGAFAFVMRDPSAGLGLLTGMMAHLHQGVDDIFKRVYVVVDEQETLLILYQFLFQDINVFLFLVHFKTKFGGKNTHNFPIGD
jgi:hypothetical protein